MTTKYPSHVWGVEVPKIACRDVGGGESKAKKVRIGNENIPRQASFPGVYRAALRSTPFSVPLSRSRKACWCVHVMDPSMMGVSVAGATIVDGCLRCALRFPYRMQCECANVPQPRK